MSVTRFYQIAAKPGRGDAVAAILSEIVDIAAAAAGCEGIDILRDRDDADCLLLVELWDSVESHGAALSALPSDLIGSLMAELATPLTGRYLDTIKST